MITNTPSSISGWGNFPQQECIVHYPSKLNRLRDCMLGNQQSSYISRGLGRSYGDSALNENAGVISSDRWNHFYEFNESTGVVHCECGISLEEIINTFLPRGWFLPTTPGTKYVTVGGAIAADVHGKNHHQDGSFGNFVVNFQLLLASGEVVTCSKEENQHIFWATIGGMGLTGVILSAHIQLISVETAYYHVSYQQSDCLDHTLECFDQTDANFRYSVAWIDCLASGKSLGKSVIMQANDMLRADLPPRLKSHPLEIKKHRKRSIPFNLPSITLNRWSVAAFNTLYYKSNKTGQKIVDYESFFYPLDSVLHWNRIYGRRGFVQYQVLFPRELSQKGLVALLEKITQSRRASFLAVLKSCGDSNPGFLSYPLPGHTLALDFPNTGTCLFEFTRELDKIVLDHGGRLYLAKDALTDAQTFAQMYPALDEFKRVKAQIDPCNRFSSSQSRRLGITEVL